MNQKGIIILQYRGSNLALRDEKASTIVSCELKAHRFRLLEQIRPEELTLQFRIDDFDRDIVMIFKSKDIHWQGINNVWPRDEEGKVIENEVFAHSAQVLFIGAFRVTKFIETHQAKGLERYLEDYNYTAIFEEKENRRLYRVLQNFPFLRMKDIL